MTKREIINTVCEAVELLDHELGSEYIELPDNVNTARDIVAAVVTELECGEDS